MSKWHKTSQQYVNVRTQVQNSRIHIKVGWWVTPSVNGVISVLGSVADHLYFLCFGARDIYPQNGIVNSIRELFIYLFIYSEINFTSINKVKKKLKMCDINLQNPCAREPTHMWIHTHVNIHMHMCTQHSNTHVIKNSLFFTWLHINTHRWYTKLNGFLWSLKMNLHLGK